MSSIILCNAKDGIVKDGKTYYAPVIMEENDTKQETGWEIPTIGEKYFTGRNPEVYYTWRGDKHDHKMLEEEIISINHNFLVQHMKHLQLWNKIVRWQALNDVPSKKSEYYFISYYNGKFQPSGVHHVDIQVDIPGIVKFSSYDKAAECIQVFSKELEEDRKYEQRLDQGE